MFSSVRGGAFLDIGANVGLYSLLSKSLCPDRSVYAFEPFPPVLDVLRTNIGLNPFAADIVVVPQAVSDKVGTASLYIPTQEHGLVEMSASLSSTFKSRHSEIVQVSALVIDNFCQDVVKQPVSVIKIDVEGAEADVLAGCHGIIRGCRPFIFCEMLPHTGTWSSIVKLMRDTSYLVAAIRHNSIALVHGWAPDASASNYIMFAEETERLVQNAACVADVPFHR